MEQVGFQQIVKLVKPSSFVNEFIWPSVSLMNGLSKQACHIFRPLLFRVKLRQVFQLAQEVGHAHLVIQKIKGKIRAVPVGHRHHVF